MCKFINTITILTVIFCISACSSKLFTVYKIDVQQGNAVEPEKVEMIEIGMNREQVKFLLGTPMVADIFHPDRWDYIYYLIPGYGDRVRRHLTLYFSGDVVSEIVKNQIEAPAQIEVESNSASSREQDSDTNTEAEPS